MPNWCNNRLTVRGPFSDVQAFKQKALGRYPWPNSGEQESNPLNFHSLVPIPDEVMGKGYAEAGYNWEVANWGCKWGSRETQLIDDSGDFLMYEFYTAWSPPIEFLEANAKQWSNLVFILEYEEPGVGFKGISKFHGESAEDHCISL